MVFTKVPQKFFEGPAPNLPIYQDFGGFLFCPWVQNQIYLSTIVFTKVLQKFEWGQSHIYLSSRILKDSSFFLGSRPISTYLPWFLQRSPRNFLRGQPQIYLSARILKGSSFALGSIYLSTMVFTKVPQKFERGQPQIYLSTRILKGSSFFLGSRPVSYTHLTLPTNREV